MPITLRGTQGESRYGYRVATRFGAWESTQSEGDPGILIDVEDMQPHPLWSTYEPTELRLKLGERWMVYRIVEMTGDAQFRVEGKWVQTS